MPLPDLLTEADAAVDGWLDEVMAVKVKARKG